MIEDYKKLIPIIKSAPVLNKLMDAFNTEIGDFEKNIVEAFNMLNIDQCSGIYLDNLGMLIGIYRPVITNANVVFLKSDNLLNSVDTSLFYVKDAKDNANDSKILADDNYYRMLIKSQIIRNNMKTYSVNDLEHIAKLIFYNEDFKVFYAEVRDYETWEVDIHIDDNFSHNSIVFLQSSYVDVYGRRKYHFPYPSMITKVNIVQD